MKSHASINRLYRLVWNATLNLWVAVAENAKGSGKGGSSRSRIGFTSAISQGFSLNLADTTVTYNGSTQTGTSLAGVLGGAAAGRNTGAYPSGYYSVQQGYDISGGGMTIDKLALTGSIASGSSTYGNSLTAGTVIFNNLVSGDDVAAGTVTVNASGNTSSSGYLNAGSYTGIESVGSTLSGTDAGNYNFAGAVGDYTVNKLALTGTITTGTSTYGSSLSTGTASFTNVVGSDSSRVEQRYLAWQ